MVFLDESGVLMAPLVRRSWSPLGQTPVLYQRLRKHKKVSAIAALCVSPSRDRLRLYFRLYPDTNVRSPLVCDFLRNLRRQLGGPIVLLWDRLHAHQSKQTRQFLQRHPEFCPFFLPPYAPELNPVEHLWAYLKTNSLANYPIDEVEELANVTRRYSRGIQRKEHLLRSFLKHSSLSFCLS